MPFFSASTRIRPLRLLAPSTLLVLALVLIVCFNRGSALLPYLSSSRSCPCRDDTSADNTALLDHTLNATLGFQKILVVSMKSATNRRDLVALAASMTGLQIEFIDGVTDFDSTKSLPQPLWQEPALHGTPLNKAQYGSWRAHMNAIRAIVDQNLTSALILEDDGDWDIGIKSQMRDFARTSQLLLQPIQGTNSYLDTTRDSKTRKPDSTHLDIDLARPASPITQPASSPYGDLHRWDVLWLGHCGMYFAPNDDARFPLGRILQRNDSTVVESQHFAPGYGPKHLVDEYPPHTRVTFHASHPLCNLAYGLSLSGARKLLLDMGVEGMSSTTDQMMSEICNGDWGRRKRVCVGVQPPLFVHHYRGPKGGTPWTTNLRHSAKVNVGKLVEGETDYVTNWPDGEPWREYSY